MNLITKKMGCKKLAYWSEAEIPTLRNPEKTSVTWHVRVFGEHKKIDVNWGVYPAICGNYRARFYDPEIARWHVIDPHAENRKKIQTIKSSADLLT